MRAALDRAERHARHVRDLRLGVAPEVSQLDDLALPLGVVYERQYPREQLAKLSPEARDITLMNAAIVDSMRQHADYLDKFPTGGNWKTMESNGLFHVAVLFPEKGLRFAFNGKWATWGTTAFVTLFLGFGIIRMAITPGFGTPSEHWISRLNLGK